MIEQRMKNGGISQTQLKQIQTNIRGHIGGQQIAGKSTAMWDNWRDKTTYGAQFFNA
jgi:type 1 glutamine amidotransferase